MKYWISALRNFDCMEIFPSNSPYKRPPLVRSIMVIELSGDVSGMHLVWNHTRDFKIGRASSASSTWNHKPDLRSKLHDTKFNYHFITAIFSQNQYFIDRAAGSLKSGSKKAFYIFYIVTKSKKDYISFCIWNRNDAIWNMNDAIYERCDLEEKTVWIVNKTHCWDRIRFQGSPVISKWI